MHEHVVIVTYNTGLKPLSIFGGLFFLTYDPLFICSTCVKASPDELHNFDASLGAGSDQEGQREPNHFFKGGRKMEWEVKYYPEYWDGKKLAYPHVPKEHPKFARTEVVGNLVIVSGCEALNHDTVKVETSDFKEQTRICLEKIKVGMAETGGSIDNLVKTYVLLKDIRDYPVYRDVEQEFFKKHAPSLAKNPPASTIINVSSLALPEFLVEVEAFGVINQKAPGWTTKYYPGSKEASSSASAGKLLFLSGYDGSNPKTGKMETTAIDQQINIALDKVKAALERAGSSMGKVVKTFMLLKRLEDYPKMRKAEVEYYQKHAPQLVDSPPVSTFMQLTSMTNPEALFEVDVTAVL